MAWAEPTLIVACIRDGDAPKMRTHSKHNKPLRLFHPRVIGFGVSEVRAIILRCSGNLSVCPMPDENGLSSPLDGGRFPQRNGRQIYLHRARGEHVRGRGHAIDELEDEHARRGRRNELGGAQHHIRKCPLRRIARHEPVLVVVVVVDVRYW